MALIEDGFVQMYARDFVVLASRAELGTDVEQGLARRITEVRSHAALMDARKGPGHLDAVAERLRHEAASKSIRLFRNGSSPAEALERRASFLEGVIAQIAVSNEDDGSESLGLEPTRIPRVRR
jgi:hypothetical protein